MTEQAANKVVPPDDPFTAKRLARQAKWFALAKAGIALLALLMQFVLVRYLSVTDYAGYTIFIGAVTVMVLLTMFGLDRVVYRFMPPLRSAGRWREIAWLMLALLALRLLSMGLLLLLCGWLLQPWLPQPVMAQLQTVAWQCLAYAMAMSATDSLPFFCNALGQQGRQAILNMAATCLRLLLVLALVWQGGLELAEVTALLALTEILLALSLAGLLWREMRQLRRQVLHAHPVPAGLGLQFGFTWRGLARDALSTQLAYLLALPFRGNFLRLIVGSVASPLVTASFGFFQTLADRVYQFMPIFLMKGMLEPALTADYAKRGDVGRIRLTVSLLLRLNALLLALACAILLGCGKELIDLLTAGRYGSEVWLACLILLQLLAMSLGEALWISLNPIGRIAHHNRLWARFALLCYGLLALAAYLRDPMLLVAVSALPYLLVFLWLRYVSREASLQSGLELPRLLRLSLPLLLAAGLARLVLLAGTAWWWGVLAALLACVSFVLVLRMIGLFQRAEVEEVAALSPRLGKILRPLSA